MSALVTKHRLKFRLKSHEHTTTKFFFSYNVVTTAAVGTHERIKHIMVAIAGRKRVWGGRRLYMRYRCTVCVITFALVVFFLRVIFWLSAMI